MLAAAPASSPASSPASARGRRALELALRAIALGALALVLWRAVRPRPPVSAARFTHVAADSLVRWVTRARSGDALEVALTTTPTAAERAWLAAIARAGHSVRWRDSGVAPLAVAVEPRTQPARGLTLLAAAARGGTTLRLGDAGGTLDSVHADGVALDVAALAGRLDVRTRGAHATAAAAESVVVRRVLVVGAAGWESKFTVAAIEESGWDVDAVLTVAPGVRVGANARDATPDTARHAAVVLLDTTAATVVPAVARYVRSGGGVVIAGSAAAVLPLVRVSAPDAREGGIAGAVAGDAPRTGLAARVMSSIGPTAVALERRGAGVVVAARRLGPGRVVQLGYDETWRWRMEGADDAPVAHRAWWSDVVASVAYAPVVARAVTSPVATAAVHVPDAAPRAALLDALGPPVQGAAERVPVAPRRAPPDSLLFAIALAALLAEWTSRRLRGAR